MTNSMLGKRVIALLASGIVILSIFLLHRHHPEIRLSLLASKPGTAKSYKEYVAIGLISTVDTGEIVRVDMVIPCKSKSQKNDLKNNVKKVKSDLLIRTDQKKIREFFDKGDFTAVKSEYLKIINRHTHPPVEDLYFDSIIRQ